MSIVNDIEYIKVQIIETEKLLKLVGGHPIMSKSYSKRLERLKSKLENMPKDSIEPKVTMLFSGNAVQGSLGIKSNFISETLKPFQEFVKTQTAFVRFGDNFIRKRKKQFDNTELYLTALPIGSFGVELTQLETNQIFEGTEVATALKQTIELINNMSKSDSDFEEVIEKLSKKSIDNLKKFLKPIYEEKSLLQLESGSFSIKLSEEKVHQTFERIDQTTSSEEEIVIKGILRGVMLESYRFEIIDEEGKKITGNFNEELSENEIDNYTNRFFNKSCKIHIKKYITKFKSNKEKISFELLDIKEIA